MVSIGTKAMDITNAASVYRQSFGNFPDSTAYNPGMSRQYKSYSESEATKAYMKETGFAEYKSIGWRAEMFAAQGAQVKALTTTDGSGGATTQALIPVFIDPRIVDISRKETPLTELIPRVSNQGIVAAYVRVTAKGGATTLVEDGALEETNNTRVQANKTIKYLYAVGRVTGPAEQAIPAFTLGGFNPTGSGLGGSPFADASAPNAMQQEVLLAARSLKQKEEDLIINGNSTTSGSTEGVTGANGTEFDGIVTQQSTTNQLDLSGDALSWDDVEETITLARVAGGRPNLALASPSALIALRKIMIDTFRMSPADNATELAFGISAHVTLHTTLGAIPVIDSRFLSDTAAQRSIYFLDMDWIEMRVLLDMSFEELAKTNDSRKFMLKIYETLIMRAPEFNAFIDNIA